jgi:hypothetical protein
MSVKITIEFVFPKIGLTGKGTGYVLRHHNDTNDAKKTPQ